MNETQAREEIVRHGRSMFDRGLTGGSTGNISVRIGSNVLMTPTGSSLGNLNPDTLSLIDESGQLISGDPPTKEVNLHLGVYSARPDAAAVVHLHSPYAVAVSCLSDIDEKNALPPITAYYVMRVGRLPLVKFHPPGAKELADDVKIYASQHQAMLLAHHGPIVAGKSLAAAADSIEELEQTARLFLMLRGQSYRSLSEEQIRTIPGSN